MKQALQKSLITSGLILGVLIIFLANVMGVIELNTYAAPWLIIKSGLFFRSPVTGSIEFIVLSLTGLLLSFLLPLLKPVTASILTVVCAVLPVYINFANPGSHPLLPMEYSLLTILMLYVINVLISYFDEARHKHKIMEDFGRYIPPHLVRELSKQPGIASLEGEARILTVLFCDIQEFTGVAEQLNSKQLVRLLNEYFTAMSSILHKYDATIDKYIGDSIMTFWGAPIPQQDHAGRAVMAALEMHEEMQEFSQGYIKRGWPALKMGIGVNTGMMSVGNMGSRFRLSYTVLGDAVNLASRLETLTRIYKVPTIVGENTVKEIDDIAFRELDIVQVRGKQKKTRIYQPLYLKQQLTGELQSQLDQHQQAMDEYYSGNLDKAQLAFRQLGEDFPDDQYYGYMLTRVAEKSRHNRA